MCWMRGFRSVREACGAAGHAGLGGAGQRGLGAAGRVASPELQVPSVAPGWVPVPGSDASRPGMGLQAAAGRTGPGRTLGVAQVHTGAAAPTGAGWQGQQVVGRVPVLLCPAPQSKGWEEWIRAGDSPPSPPAPPAASRSSCPRSAASSSRVQTSRPPATSRPTLVPGPSQGAPPAASMHPDFCTSPHREEQGPRQQHHRRPSAPGGGQGRPGGRRGTAAGGVAIANTAQRLPVRLRPGRG